MLYFVIGIKYSTVFNSTHGRIDFFREKWYHVDMMKENEFRQLVAVNLVYYRRLNNLTQIELAEKLNYSDKSISKWERGESLPDLYILQEIAALYGITLNDLVSAEKTVPRSHRGHSKLLAALISFGAVWFVATVAFVALGIFLPALKRSWLAFVYAVPASTAVLIVLSNLWGKRLLLFLTLSVFYWTVPLAIVLSIDYGKLWLLFIGVIPLQILTIIWFLLKRKRPETGQEEKERAEA